MYGCIKNKLLSYVIMLNIPLKLTIFVFLLNFLCFAIKVVGNKRVQILCG